MYSNSLLHICGIYGLDVTFCDTTLPSGEEVGFYFGWMFFYMKFICAPLVIGLGMYALRPGGITVDTDPYLPVFSIVMALWGVLFLVVSGAGS